MTPEQMRAKSQAKFKQVNDLLALLQISIEPKQKINRDGYIDHVIVFNDNEKYPEAPVETPKPAQGEESTQSTEELPVTPENEISPTV